ncbi:MAG: hypothetical protein ACJAXL_001417 [Alphaproteobacteria bacterium]|jgi:hypothetical protein
MRQDSLSFWLLFVWAKNGSDDASAIVIPQTSSFLPNLSSFHKHRHCESLPWQGEAIQLNLFDICVVLYYKRLNCFMIKKNREN